MVLAYLFHKTKLFQFISIYFQCGVPKKGHICPYQPKLKRRPDEPPPVMKNAATQVEIDEYMILRRLNLEIQGYPESYASEPNGNDTHNHNLLHDKPKQ